MFEFGLEGNISVFLEFGPFYLDISFIYRIHFIVYSELFIAFLVFQYEIIRKRIETFQETRWQER